MASIQEPEVQFAQRLASNEKPVRTKAIKKLRTYINVRSQKAAGGFLGDELLKLWKGLFYCLWMQDKPLLQEELSNQISTLIHSFHNIDGQLLYLESFLQTFKREWTGIDRLRMDKFFQLVRFMFRQTFEMLKRKNWESSEVARFLELLTEQLLQSGSCAPSGLQFHVLDIYMTELAAVGSAELTADQNLIFLEPFCKTAAKTKDRTLFSAICNSIFSTIIDQAPFAIEDLIKEVKAAEAADSDSGQASKHQLKEETMSNPVSRKGTGEQINGNRCDDDDDDDDNELLHWEDFNTDMPYDDNIGPVLQFDYAALADKLFNLASRSSTPSQNRQRLYKIIKVLRDLNEGIFPQNEYPEEVSTDEDDEMFGSRKRMKRRGGHMEEGDEEGAPSAKKRKKKETSILNKQNKDSGKDYEPAGLMKNNDKKKKKKKKKKAGQGASAGGEEQRSGQKPIVAQTQSTIKEAGGGLQCSHTEDFGKEALTQSSISSVIVTGSATPESQSETLLLSEGKKQPLVTVAEKTSQPTPCTINYMDQYEKSSKNEKKEQTSELKHEVTEAAGEQQSPARSEPELSSETDARVSGGGKKKGLKKFLTDGILAKSKDNEAAEIATVSGQESAEENMTRPETDIANPAKKKKKGSRADKNLQEVEDESTIKQRNVVSTELDFPSICSEDLVEGGPTTGVKKLTDSTTPAKKRSKKKKPADAQFELEGKSTIAKITSVGEEASEDATTVTLKVKTKKKGKQEDTVEASTAADESIVNPLKKKNKTKSQATVKEGVVAETNQVVDAKKLLFEITMTTPAKKKKKTAKLAASEVDEIKDPTQLQVVGCVDPELQLNEPGVPSSSRKLAKNKKRKIPVVFEFEVHEQEAAAQKAASIKGFPEKETVVEKTKLGSNVAEPSTQCTAKKSHKRAKACEGSASDLITFKSNTAVPTPLFCKTNGSLNTPLSCKKLKKSRTPKSESKKVTFGLKNNKTAEFRKTDRSLLVSPDGSSRVPFDPKQKPKFGVLKSPVTPLSTNVKKTPNGNRKTRSSIPKSMPKQRPSAADFF